MKRLAAWCFRHGILVIALWVVVLAALAGVTKVVGRDYIDGFSLPGTDSNTAAQLLAHAGQLGGAGDDTVVIHMLRPGVTVTDATVRATVTEVLGRSAAQPLVVSVHSPYAAGGQGQIS